MRFSTFTVAALAFDTVIASTWIGKTAYNKWHQTELERWLADHDIPHPAPADRKDLENLVKENWHSKVTQPYNGWDVNQLQAYLISKGYEVKKGTEQSKDGLVAHVKSYWTDTEESIYETYANVRDWIFDSWTDSQLKAFLDRHGIPSPQPRNRDTLLKTARENYHSVATKAGETAAYPGNWLYESWSESDLKAWLDERGIPVPQPTSRDKLIASVRRNSHRANIRASSTASSASASAASLASAASASAASAQAGLSDALLNAWSDSQIKEWADKNGIKVPQGSKRNELLALARKHRAKLTGDTVASSASSYYGAATSQAGNQYARATDDASYVGSTVVGKFQSLVSGILQLFGSYGIGPEASAARSSASAASAASSIASSASRSAASVAASASASAKAHKAKNEL